MSTSMKRLIADTFMAMLATKSIDKITVRDLVEECRISRQAFYYHFKDTLDVIEWAMEQGLQEATEKSLRAESPERAIEYFINLTNNKYELIYRLLHSQKREHLEKFFIQGIQAYLQKLIASKAEDFDLQYGSIEVTLQFYTCGIAGLLLIHCGDKNLDAEKLASQICQMMRRSPRQN